MDIAFMRTLGEVWRCANLYRAAQYGPLGLNVYQDTYLLNICAMPGISQDRLTLLIYVHKSNVARQLASLEEKDFITRTPDPQDRRSLLVYPTKKAQAALPAIRKAHRMWNDLVLRGFTQEEAEQLAAALKRLAENAHAIVAEEKGGTN